MTSCAAKKQEVKPPQLVQYPITFDAAIKSMANNLAAQIQNYEARNQEKVDEEIIGIVIDPFFDADSGEIPGVSFDIEKKMISEIESKYEDISIKRLSPSTLEKAKYVLNGTIHLDYFNEGDKSFSRKYYRVSSSAVDLSNGKVIANADVWISDRDLDYKRTPVYEDSPMYLKDDSMDSAVSTSEKAAGEQAGKNYFNSLEINAILSEAGTAYNEGDYVEALNLFQKAANSRNGQIMKTYAGLYMTHYKLGNTEKASSAYSELIKISVEKYNNLTVKFLFNVNSVEFWDDPNLKRQYGIWIKEIGGYFSDQNYCLQIVGHSSHSGPIDWNDKLSLMRARRIQELLKPHFETVFERSEAIGKGFRENIVGTGTDDERDAPDRRVEFKVVNCGLL